MGNKFEIKDLNLVLRRLPRVKRYQHDIWLKTRSQLLSDHRDVVNPHF